MRRLPLELIERLRALRPTAETPQDHVGFVATAAGVYFLIAAVIEVWRFLAADIIMPVWRVLRPWLFVVALILVLPSAASAAEAACTALGANCLCSEPLQMTALAAVNTSWMDPNDTSTLECKTEGAGTAAIARNAQDLVPSSDSTILAALPAGHSVARVLKGPEGHVGGLQLGHLLAAGDPHGRIVTRVYLYFSSNFQFKFEGACENTKFGESGPATQGIHWDLSPDPHIYGFLVNHTPNPDCCGTGPVNGEPNPNGVTEASWKGKWWRLTFVIRNATGSSGIVYEAYRKNVTNNLPEEMIIGTGVSCPACGTGINNWGTAAATTLTPPNRQDFVHSNQYRQNVCAGFNAWSHLMVAAFATDSGQMIGPATEVEGGTPSRGFILRLAIPILIALGLVLWRASVSL